MTKLPHNNTYVLPPQPCHMNFSSWATGALISLIVGYAQNIVSEKWCKTPFIHLSDLPQFQIKFSSTKLSLIKPYLFAELHFHITKSIYHLTFNSFPGSIILRENNMTCKAELLGPCKMWGQWVYGRHSCKQSNKLESLAVCHCQMFKVKLHWASEKLIGSGGQVNEKC